MNQTYNYFQQQECPVLTLCTPNKDELFALPFAYEIKNTQRYNAISELTFKYPKSKDGGITTDPAYSYIKGKMLVLVENIGYYIIRECPENDSGATPIKDVSCFSLEAEMLTRRITGFTGTYQFQTLLETVLSLIPTWSIGTISSSLLPLYRTFTANNSTIYNFLVTDLEKAYGCVFEFDTFNRTISAISNVIPSANTNIFLSFDNLVSKIQFKEISEELCTRLYCYGGGSLDIHYVNPLGSNAIYDFTYFKTTAWMSQGLIDALTSWETNVETQQPIYAGKLTNLETYRENMIILQADLSDLNAQLTSMEAIREARIQQELDTTEIDAKIAAQLILISSKGIDIASTQQNIDFVMSELRKIVHSLYFTTRISYDNFEEDVLNIETDLSNMINTWTNIYNSTSTSPGFDPALLLAETPTISNLILEAANETQILYNALVVGFSSYPPSEDDLDILTGYINQIVSTINELYSILQTIIPNTTITMSLDEIRATLIAYLDIISYSSNMTEAQYLELCPYIYENTYVNNNIIITDSMTPVEVQTQSQELYDQSLTVLGKVSVPRYEFTGEFSNFITLENFSSFTDELELGKVINIRKDDNTTIEAVLLELVITYDNPTDFSMTFSNSFRLDNSSFIYSDILGAAAQMGSNTGATAITQGSIAGWTVSAGNMSMPYANISSQGYISFGEIPPTTYGNNIGAWLGYSGAPKISLYSNINNYFQWDGTKLLIKAENFTLDNLGNITATNATLSGSMTAGGGAVLINDDGITINYNAETNSLRFLNSDGEWGASIYMSFQNMLGISAYKTTTVSTSIGFTVEMTNGANPSFHLLEDPANPNVFQADFTLGPSGSKLTMGGEVEIRDYGGYRYFKMTETTTPPVPGDPWNFGRLLYPKSDGWYDMDYLGVETKLAGGIKATGAELDVGTDDVKFATAKALKDSHNVPSVAPSTSGNVLTSNGTDWISALPSNGGLVYNVKDYGAYSDGSNPTANYTILQNLLNSLATISPNGAIIYFPPGIYAINSTLLIGNGGGVGTSTYNGVTIMGAGTGQNFEYSSSYNLGATILRWVSTGAGPLLKINGSVHGCKICDISLDGGGYANTLLNVNYGHALMVENVDGYAWKTGYAVVISTIGVIGAGHLQQTWVHVRMLKPSDTAACGLDIGPSGSGYNHALGFFSCVFARGNSPSSVGVRLGCCDHIDFVRTYFMVNGTGGGVGLSPRGIQVLPNGYDNSFPNNISFSGSPILGGIYYTGSPAWTLATYPALTFHPYYTADSQIIPPNLVTGSTTMPVNFVSGITDTGRLLDNVLEIRNSTSPRLKLTRPDGAKWWNIMNNESNSDDYGLVLQRYNGASTIDAVKLDITTDSNNPVNIRVDGVLKKVTVDGSGFLKAI